MTPEDHQQVVNELAQAAQLIRDALTHVKAAANLEADLEYWQGIMDEFGGLSHRAKMLGGLSQFIEHHPERKHVHGG